MNALLRRLLPPYIARIEAAELWKHSADCDVVYAFWPHGRPFQAAQAAVVCTYQDTTFLDFPEILGGSASLRERDYAESWLNGAARVVVSSKAVQQRLTFHFGERFADVRVIHHNILPEQGRNFTPAKPQHLPERYILYPANINPHKNHDMLLIAWARFSR
ncbi:MAG: hypothetical protein IT319_11450, partial [Anaerolineae bacterium]|nr:hypothetical protein [Anaerolineae bacterium]